MKIRVLFFGATADAVGSRIVDLDVDISSTVGKLTSDLCARYPPLRDHKLLTAINEEYSDRDRILVNGDEVAVFTAVSGG